jgi:hypothetical protein
MRPLRASAVCLFALVVLAGCTSTKVISRQSNIEGEKIARPGRILVNDFAASPADVPPDSVIAGELGPHTEQTPKELEAGRKLGATVAQELVDRITAMGLPAALGRESSPPKNLDLVIRGYFVSVDQGSTVKRVLVGFGSGAAELKTVVEVLQKNEGGLRRLGSGELGSGARGGAPGMVVPVIVTAATANPIGLIVGGAVKAGIELSGTQGIEASGKRTADEIADQLKVKFKEQGWIDSD